MDRPQNLPGVRTIDHFIEYVELTRARYRDVKSSICLTLGCYLNDNLAELSHIQDCDTLEKQVSLSKSAWPSHGDLVMSVKYGDTRAISPLCPPFQVLSIFFLSVWGSSLKINADDT